MGHGCAGAMTPHFPATYLTFSGKLKSLTDTKVRVAGVGGRRTMGTSPSPVFLSVKCVYHTMLMVTGTSHNLHSSQKHTQELSVVLSTTKPKLKNFFF